MSGPADTIAGLDLERRRELERHLLARRPARAATARIAPRTGDGELPLSYAQQRLWFIHRLDPLDPGYNIHRCLRVEGPLDVDRLRRAIAEVCARHEALRTSFPASGGRPRQAIAPPGPPAFDLVELAAPDEGDSEARLRTLLEEAVRRPFDLAAGPVLRTLVVRLAPDAHVVALMLHHIVGDEWSLRVLNEEIAAAYAGDGARLPALPIQYADFALWQRRWVEGDAGAAQLAYWRQRLAGVPERMELMPGRPRPAVQALRALRHRWRIADDVVARLDRLAHATRATPFMVSLAAFMLLLQRYSGRDDIVVGTPVSGRQRPETERLIGFFANTLALRVDAAGDPSFVAFLGRVRDCVLAGFENQDVPFETVVDAVGPPRSRSHLPLVQLLFTHRRAIDSALAGSQLRLSPIDLDDGIAKCDLWLAIEDGAQGRHAMIEIDAALFDRDGAARMAGHLDRLLGSIAAGPESRLSALDLVPPDERAWLARWSGAAATSPISGSIAALFAAQVARAPDGVALICGETQLSYAELDRWATRLARLLRASGIGPERVVAIAAARSPALIAGLLAIVKAGGAYLPIDPSLPPARVALMLRDAGACLVLAEPAARSTLAVHGVPVLELAAADDAAPAAGAEPCPDASGPDTLAYVMFTSGSTGTPKAVAIAQRGVIRLVRDTSYARFGPEERVLQLAPVSFDASTFEIWGALLNGGCLVQVATTPASLGEIARTIVAGRVTTLWLTAGLFQQMVDHALESFAAVGQVLAGGDVLSVTHVRRFRAAHPRCRLINGYGPTEGTTFSCTYEIDDDGALDPSVPIGRPIANTEAHVLDGQLRPVGIGMVGELCIGGAGLARGYVDRPELTAASFVVSPHVPGRLYRTGDLVRHRADGTLQFLGRRDRQLKLRGFRIEPGEIEAALLAHRSVRQAVVAMQAGARGEQHLVAYCVPDPAAPPPAPPDLQAHLRQLLPAHMIPAAIGVLPALPLTAQGKIDLAALPAVDAPPAAQAPRAPRDALETRLAASWSRLLGVANPGIDDDFFALGGHSLLAAELFADIDRMLGHPLPLATIFEAPTIALLAERMRASAQPRPWPKAVRIRDHGAEPPLFAVPGIGGNVVGFAALARHLGADRPLIGLPARGLDGREAPHGSIEAIAREHIAQIRAHRPHGPYVLLGACIGGVIAYEIAQQLRAAGEPVGHLLLLDPAFRGAALPGADRRARRKESRRPGVAGFMADRARLYAAELARLPVSAWGGYALGKMRMLGRTTSEGRLAADVRRELAQDRVIAAHRQALEVYVPRPYAGSAVVFRSADRRPSIGRVLLDMRELCSGGVVIETVPGADSGSALQEPHVASFVARLRARLDQDRDHGAAH